MDIKAKTGTAAFGIVGGLVLIGSFAAVCAMFFLAGATYQPSLPSSKVSDVADPWPECAAVREFLRQHPAKGEVTTWETRTLRGDVGPENLVYLRVQLRTSQGAQPHMFVFGVDGRYRDDY